MLVGEGCLSVKIANIVWGKIKRKFGNMLKEKTLNSLLLTA